MFIATLLFVQSAGAASAETRLTVMTFNMWGAGANEDKPAYARTALGDPAATIIF